MKGGVGADAADGFITFCLQVTNHITSNCGGTCNLAGFDMPACAHLCLPPLFTSAPPPAPLNDTQHSTLNTANT